MLKKQLLFVFATILTSACSSWGAPLDCDSNVRIILPQLFTHCSSCSYSEWSKWQFVSDSIVDVPRSQCDSGQSYSESRSRSAIGDGCYPETETRVICLPDQEDLLIEALGLGSSHSDESSEDENSRSEYSSSEDENSRSEDSSSDTKSTSDSTKSRSDGSSNSDNRSKRYSSVSSSNSRSKYDGSPVLLGTPPPDDDDTGAPGVIHLQAWVSQKLCPGTGRNGPICTGALYSTGKRSSSHAEYRPFRRATRERVEPAPLPEAPIPYNRQEHGTRFRRSHHCQPDGAQHIIFVLDTSGSIGQASFTRITAAISKLTALFCSPPKVAAMTFDDVFNLEFCFDCFSTDRAGRAQAAAAIQSIPWRRGLTYTGGAARCVCDKILTPACGMHPFATCTDVVFITDGHSNDPKLKVCDEIKCLHNHLNGINTHAIGINLNHNNKEIDCIASSSNVKSVFRYDDFDDFEDAIERILKRLIIHGDVTHSDKYKCTFNDESLGN